MTPGRRLLLAFALAAVLACSTPPPPVEDPLAQAALRPFRLAQEGGLDEVDLDRYFDTGDSERRRVELLDALDRLAAWPLPRLEDREHRPGAREAFVDLTAELPGEGQARYSVMLRQAEDGTWRVSWLQGPGLQWPAAPTSRGQRLTTSSHPGDP